MTRKEREANPEESFDGGYHLFAEEKHRERVAKNPDRIAYAIEQFKMHGTGKIQGYQNARGIHALIRMLEG